MDKIHALCLQVFYHWAIPEKVTNNRLENIDSLFRCDQDKMYKERANKAIEEGKEGSKMQLRTNRFFFLSKGEACSFASPSGRKYKWGLSVPHYGYLASNERQMWNITYHVFCYEHDFK